MTSRSWLQIAIVAALALSVIANFFMLGALAKVNRAGPAGSVVADALARAYPDDVRAEFRRLLGENRSQTVAALREVRQARRALADSSSATPFVESDVEQAMQRVRAATGALQAMMQGLLLDALRNTRQQGQR